MLVAALFISSVLSLPFNVNGHDGASLAIADAGDVQAVQAAHGYQPPASYEYVRNLALPGGTVYGSDGSVTEVVPNVTGNGGYTTYGSDGSSGTYEPNLIGSGGTFYTNGNND